MLHKTKFFRFESFPISGFAAAFLLGFLPPANSATGDDGAIRMLSTAPEPMVHNLESS